MAITKTVTQSDHAAGTFEEVTVFTGYTYDLVKKLVQIVLPALGSLYFGLSQTLELPAGEEVIGIIALVTTFLGTLLGISHGRYNNSDAPYQGEMIVTEDGGGVSGYTLSLDGDPEALAEKDSVAFKVRGIPRSRNNNKDCNERHYERVIMFGKFRKDEPSIYDEPIEKVLDSMRTYDTVDSEFTDALEYLERLTKLKAEKHKSRLDPNQMAIVAGNLLGILVIVAYEQKHVMTSKAMSFILKAK